MTEYREMRTREEKENWLTNAASYELIDLLTTTAGTEDWELVKEEVYIRLQREAAAREYAELNK